ncbi:putative methyltransferase [Paractinoplanes abujensis]|uniref:SAM-dependent methyltransferase n=1 Tax=Paractinoplanes abujensis TaxID=882441 RepID=A0A7W7G1N9_9ACTN|nr:class I SAM-dependent methyltransferase [Actinoplanes abujensis]MBB4692829.1 SAM-dependent methyltransferase [Actinoplanes abujensis]GID22672.1 putative methyltransferase [Actinoplanes abujensis]
MTNRALTFGAIAQAYERFRPGYPPELLDVVAGYAGRPITAALEIGAGTGKATRLLAGRVGTVTAVEPDEAMLTELRKHVPANVETASATFESFRPRRHYDLVYAAAALHWTEPHGRWQRVARMLGPGGVFASFGGPLRLADPALDEAVSRARRPFLDSDDAPIPAGPWPDDELRASPWFTDVQPFTIERRLSVSAADYVGHLSTVSAYLALPLPVRERVYESVARVLPATVDLVADITGVLARSARDGDGQPGHA